MFSFSIKISFPHKHLRADIIFKFQLRPFTYLDFNILLASNW